MELWNAPPSRSSPSISSSPRLGRCQSGPRPETAGLRGVGTSRLCESSFLLLLGHRQHLRLRQRRLQRANGADGPAVVEDGTLMGDRPKVRYIWQVPQAAGPEIVLVGRSNAGKSTLLNEILGANGLKKAAPTSEKGGRTRTLNWYPIGFEEPIGWAGNGVRLGGSGTSQQDELMQHGKGCCLVDCFGLGPVDFSLTARRLQTWGPVLQQFISERRAISMVCHLISCEQEGGLSEGDRQLLDIFQRCEAERSRKDMMPFRYVVVLTKTDLCRTPDQVATFQAKLQEQLTELGQRVYEIVSCSSMSEDGSGIQEVQLLIDEAKVLGWKGIEDWLPDAFLEPKPPGGGRTTTQRRELRAKYAQAAKQSARKPARGGPGAKTVLPPSV